MKRFLITGILAFAIARGAQAQEVELPMPRPQIVTINAKQLQKELDAQKKRTRRPFYKDKKFWLGEGIIAASVVLDAQSTCRAFARGAYETSPLLYGSRSCGTIAGASVGLFGLYSSLNILEWHLGRNDKNKYIRGFTPWMLPGAAVVLHVPAAIHNYRIQPFHREDYDREEPRHVETE